MYNKIRMVSKELNHKKTKLEFLKYVVIGVITNITYYGVFLLGVYFFKIHYTFTVVISYCLSTLIGYILNSRFSFQVMKKYNFSKYIVLYLFSMLINMEILHVFIDLLCMEAWFAQAIATIFIVLFNFLGLKFFVYKTKSNNCK